MRALDKIRAWRGEFILSWLWLIRATFRPLGLRRLYIAVLVNLVKKTGLFDQHHYLETYADVAEVGIPPVRHYVAYGDREGRAPMPVFDPQYYRSRAGGRSKHVNALLHYFFVGQYRRISPSPWFDVRYYLAQNKDVLRIGYEPISHYLKYGGLEGRSPSPQFDGAYYLREHPEVSASNLTPLLHYLKIGRRQDFPTCPGMQVRRKTASISETLPFNSEERWAAVAAPGFERPLEIDIVIPVYKDRMLTLRCIYSVLTARYETPFQLIVIDDASPEPELAADLERLAARGLFTLLRNDRNCGFVRTVNIGMALHPERDIVLLNADTEVYGNWLDRLRMAAHKQLDIASVTPLSNNATICSYPRFLHDNPYPLEIGYADLDALAASINSGVGIVAPTGVGFCMYLKRSALVQMGLFDEKAFGKGYGEENDWCQRAIRQGWRNIIAADVFVRHFGGASFQGEKSKRVADALSVLARRHPGYGAQVQKFIDEDPLQMARRRLDWARLKRQARSENILLVCHNRGGGAERHVQEETQFIRQHGKGVFYLRPERRQPAYARISHPDCKQLPNLPIYELADTRPLATALAELGITCIHSHGLVDFTKDAPEQLLALAGALKATLNVDIHDYKVICPRINLVGNNGMYCGEPDEGGCDQCLSQQENDFGATDIKAWREIHHRVLRAANKIWVPDEDVAQRLTRYYPDIEFSIAPHDDDTGPGRVVIRQALLEPDEKLRVIVIGAISKIKGYEVLLACARDAKKRRLPIDYAVMGYSHNDRLLEQAGVHVTGCYQEQDAAEMLHSLRPHAIFLPSIWPETYSYTLSLALKGGYPVFAFDIGAIAHRLKMAGQSTTLWPISLAKSPAQINNNLRAYRTTIMPDERI